MNITPHRDRVVATCLSLLLFCVPANAGQPMAEPGAKGPSRPDRPSTQGLSPREGLILRSAVKLAVRHLEKGAACSQLFDGLENEGAALLASALYRSATAEEEERVCRRGIAMFTEVGGAQIGICPGTVLRLERSALAALLIHEALHLAGLNESPPVPTAPTSSEINRQVRKNCSL